jgi:glycosyltransferase involved in cell wall biosynthesis
MKIVIVGTAYPLRGGIAHFNALLAAHLGKRHTVETITFKRQYPSFLFPGTTQAETGEAPADAAPAPALVDSINPLNWLAVAREIRRRKPDLLIFKYWLPFFGPCFGTIAKFATRGTRTKVLFICDNIIPHERRPGDVLFTKYAFGQADAFVVQSDAVEREFLALFPGRPYRKVPHPVYENFGAPVPAAEARATLGISAKKVMLYFGYVRAYKGLLVLFEAMHRLAGTPGMEDVLLLAVGEYYDDEAKYRRRAAELGLGDAVRFVSEYVPNEKVGLYFSACDAVVLPYLSATQSGIAQIAYNFNKPVIVTDVGGLAEVARDGVTGFVVPPNDPDALASAIRRFYDEGRGPAFGANVAEEKKKYSWDHLVASIEELVQGTA